MRIYYLVERIMNNDYEKFLGNIRDKYFKEMLELWYPEWDLIWRPTVVMKAVEDLLDKNIKWK